MAITYNLTTNFLDKDSLPENDPAKVIRGSEFQTEFLAIQAAFSSAAPTASPSFTGTAVFNAATMTDLEVTNPIVGSITGNVTGDITGDVTGDVTGNLTGNVTGDVTGNLTGTVLTASQTNITSVGTLSSLNVSGDLAVNTDALFVDSSSGNVGIGITPGAGSGNIVGTSQKLVVSGTNGVAQIMDSGNELAFSRSGACYISANNTGGSLFYSSNSRHVWNTNNTESMRIDANGNLLVGSSATPSAQSPRQLLYNPDTPSCYLQMAGSSNAGGVLIGANPDFGCSWYSYTGAVGSETYGSPLMTLNASGNLGIGTDNPDSILDITDASPVVTLNGTLGSGCSHEIGITGTNSQNLVLSADPNNTATSSTLRLRTGGAERMLIDDNGNVGIGTSSPATSLMVQQAGLANFSTASNQTIKLNSDGSTQNVWAGIDFGYEGLASIPTARIASQNGATGSNIAFGTSSNYSAYPVERMRIDPNGNLLVGQTTTTSASTAGLQIYSSAGVAGRINIHKTLSGAANAIANYHQGSYIGGVNYSNTATSFPTSSDIRLKENIVDAPSASADIDAIQIRSFDWKVDGTHQKYGVVAQELVDVAPDAVTQGETEDDTWGVDYSKLVPMLVKEIQELRKRVAALES